MGYNDRANEYMFNQLYLITERVTKVENGCGVDVGGRVDLLYGEDRRTRPRGLDSKWNSGRFYGLSMPQAYFDLAINQWVFRGGHFLAPCGYESVMAPENFFYSHSLSFIYAMPTTLSGGEALYKINDQWSANFGLDTGWNDWNDPTNRVNYFGGFNWTSKDQKTTFAFESFLGNTDAYNPAATRFMYCAVLTQKLGEKWHFALENDVGYDNGAIAGGNGTFSHGEWASLIPYFIYDINACWSWGLRYEWLCDNNGAVVERIGPPTAGPYAGRFNDLTIGLNWKPHQSKNVLLRTELRYDWADDSLPVGQRPFDAGAEERSVPLGDRPDCEVLGLFSTDRTGISIPHRPFLASRHEAAQQHAAVIQQHERSGHEQQAVGVAHRQQEHRQHENRQHGDAPRRDVLLDRHDAHALQKQHDQRQLETDAEGQRQQQDESQPLADAQIGIDPQHAVKAQEKPEHWAKHAEERQGGPGEKQPQAERKK